MAGLTRKNVHPLLRSVNGKRHATDDDHEEPAGKRRADNKTFPAKEQEEIDINADPLTSDDELRAPPPRPAKSSKPTMPAPRNVDTELKRPQRKPAKKNASIRAPTRGAFKNSQELKVGDGQTEDKENTLASSQVSTSDGLIQWGMEHVSQKNNKNAKGYGSKTKNIHVPAPKNFGKGPSKPAVRTYGSASQSKSKQPSQDSNSDSSVSMLDDDELQELAEELGEPNLSDDDDLRRVDSKATSKKAKDKDTGAVPYDDKKTIRSTQFNIRTTHVRKVEKSRKISPTTETTQLLERKQRPPFLATRLKRRPRPPQRSKQLHRAPPRN